jgi:hypothetical protein
MDGWMVGFGETWDDMGDEGLCGMRGDVMSDDGNGRKRSYINNFAAVT